MSNRDIDTLKDGLLQTISTSDTISQFMEKCNNNFSRIAEWGGGPDGAKGDDGDPGVPTKPKVPIHVWEKGKDYDAESGSLNEGYEIEGYEDDELTDVKYQEGHLIILENAHVYILETDNNNLKPKFLLALHSYNSGDIVNGNPGYVHFAYANSPDGIDGFITDDDIRNNNSYGNEPVSTFSLRRSSNNISAIDMPYMGVYSDNTNASSSNPNKYTWIRVQGAVGATGPKGDQGEKGDMGDKGDGYTGHPYTIDLEGDLSTISIGINGTRLYDNDYCECKLHAYYGDENVSLNPSQVSINLPEEYKSLGDGNIVLKSNESKVGQILKRVDGKNSIIQFTPDKDFVFPKKTITFTIHVNATIDDKDDGNTYTFDRDTVWMIKGISSTFELEIQPQYRIIKLDENGKYYPENLFVNVYKVEDGERTLFDFSQNTDFQLLYKNYNDNSWIPYPNEGVDTKNVSCLEFKVVRYYGAPEEEMWDYEDVWVVADGKSSHYYHADLGSTESMMILTTGDKINIGTDDEPIYCADIRSESGYSITFEPKFYDGADELEVTDVSIGANSGEEYYANGTFERELTEIEIDGITKYTFTITKVPFGVEVIPMNFVVNAKLTSDDGSEYKSDTVSFNVYISTLSNIYTLIPSVSSYNTSTGKTGDTIGCDVYKNNTLIETTDLDENGLQLKYIVHDENTESGQVINYTEPLVYGHDDDNVKDEFTASDVAIEFILYYRNKGIAKSTVPLIKDGIDGKDGDSWQYIFCRSALYPFDKTGISDPSKWTNDINSNDSNSEYLGDKENDYNTSEDMRWYDDHKGVDSEYRYEYQSYRKWDKNNQCWGKYGIPTLYSNFSESGSGYSVLLSNPVSVIPVGDDDWSVNENNKNQEDSTLVYLYNNTSDMSKDPNVTISLPENPHFEATKEDGINKVIFRPVVNSEAFDFVSNSQYKLPITLTYSLNNDDSNVDNFTTTINWTLTPTKGLSDVEVFVDKRVVNTSISNNHSLKVGYYLISSNGTKKLVEDYNEGNTKGYEIILTDDIADLSSSEVVTAKDWKNVTYNFVKNGTNRNCYIVLVEPDSKTIIDYVNVTSVNDGKDGASAIHLELTQDYIELPSSIDGGSIHQDYTEGINSKMKLYNGDKLIENNILYSFKVNDTITNEITSNDGEFNIPAKLILGDTNIECIATYNGVDFHRTLTIVLKETPYELELNKSVLTRDVNNNKIIDESLIVRVKYWMNGNWVYTPDGEVKANTSNGLENLPFGSPTGNKFDRLLMIEGSTLESNTVDTEVRISYYNGGDVELSYETIGIINNGKDGTDGKDGVDGKNGKTVYPAGKWDLNVTYTSTDNTTPYVVHNDEYWQLVVDSSKGAEPGSNNSDWIKFDKFEALFAKIGIIENGLFGSAVFNGNYMFSQTGYDTTNNNAITTEYQNFNPDDVYNSSNTFIPIICLNLKTGETSFGINSNLKINSDGTIKVGNFTISEGGLYYNKTFRQSPLPSYKKSLSINEKGIKYQYYFPSTRTSIDKFILDTENNDFKLFNALDIKKGYLSSSFLTRFLLINAENVFYNGGVGNIECSLSYGETLYLCLNFSSEINQYNVKLTIDTNSIPNENISYLGRIIVLNKLTQKTLYFGDKTNTISYGYLSTEIGCYGEIIFIHDSNNEGEVTTFTLIR